jgi:hypothetical protein
MLNLTFAGKQPHGTAHATFAVTQLHAIDCAFIAKDIKFSDCFRLMLQSVYVI